MTAEEFEAAFHGINMPESMQLYPGTFIPDLRDTVDKSIRILQETQSPAVREAVSHRLKMILEKIYSAQ